MTLNLKIISGSLVVFTFCILTLVLDESLYPPNCMSVFIPALFTSILSQNLFLIAFFAAFPTVFLYLVWSFYFINTKFKISKPTVILSIILIILSVIANISSYQYGVRYQGFPHTILMYSYNLVFLLVLAIAYKANKSNPNQNNCLGYNILLFSWLGWCAFPYLGESM